MISAVIRRFRAVVPAEGTRGPLPVWRVGTVLKSVIGLSRPERARIWRDGGVTVNGAPVAAQFVHCYPGDLVEAWYPEAASSVAPEPAIPLRVLYEDAWLLAVDKPAGQLSHPARSEQSGTVANAVAGYLGNRPRAPDLQPSVQTEVELHAGFSVEPNVKPKTRAEKEAGAESAGAEFVEPVRLVHRLDRDTSGVLLFARDAATARALTQARARGHLERTYLALVAGRPDACGEITLALGPEPGHRTRQRAYAAETIDARSAGVAIVPGGAGAIAVPGTEALAPVKAYPALTSYRVIEYGPDAAFVAVRLHTGRTHQVRAHFAAIGHPLVGDDLYGGPPSDHIGRQALHAWRTRFRHPHTGKDVTLVSPLPVDFRRAAAEALRGET